MHVLDMLCARVARIVGLDWSVEVRQADTPRGLSWFGLVPAYGGSRFVVLPPSGVGKTSAQIVAFLAHVAPLQPCAAGQAFALLATDATDPRAQALAARMARDPGMSPLAAAERRSLLEEATRLRDCLRAPAPPPPPTEPAPRLDRHALLARVVERYAGAWEWSDDDPDDYSLLLHEGERLVGLWMIFTGDIRTPAVALSVAGVIHGCASGPKQLGSNPRWTVFTWAPFDAPGSLAVAAALELGPPDAALDELLRDRGVTRRALRAAT